MSSPSAGALPSPAASKGKASMDEEAGGGDVACGICLAGTRHAVRGELDCCAHRFCFVCIMAWARVESRCPFCKARFRTIRRPPVPGRFPSERIVTVAERYQAYCPLNDAIDPYANTSCSVCNCSTDEELLLLCELCDAGSHTYCVGLGTTVPEGDWFCKDCTMSKEEHSRYQVDAGGTSDQGGFENSVEVPRADPGPAPSISDIVDDDHSLSSAFRESAQSSRSSLANPIPSIFDIVDEDYSTKPAGRDNAESNRLKRKAEHLPSQSTSAGYLSAESHQEQNDRCSLLHTHACLNVERAKTLCKSRILTKRIRALRENWPALRSGSVGFTEDILHRRKEKGTVTTCVIKEHQTCATPIVIGRQNSATPDEEHQQSAMASNKEVATISGHANKISPKDTGNIRKAWKMLEMAKSAAGSIKYNKPFSLNCTPSFSMGNRSGSYSPIDTILGKMNQSVSNEAPQTSKPKYDCRTKKENTWFTKKFEKHHSLPENYHVSIHERMTSFRDRMINQESPNGIIASSSHSQHINQTLEPFCGTVRSVKPKSEVLHPLMCSLLPARSTATSSWQPGSGTGNQSTMMVNPEGPSSAYVATANEIGTAGATIEFGKSSGPNRHKCKRKLCFQTCIDQGSKKSRTSCKIAKSEISSLVICELKLLKIDKTYGSERFKEFARAATHTVLASYGLKHLPSVALGVSRSVCKHRHRVEHLQSSAITNACRECLCDFVKEVISSVLSGRQIDQTPASC